MTTMADAARPCVKVFENECEDMPPVEGEPRFARRRRVMMRFRHEASNLPDLEPGALERRVGYTAIPLGLICSCCRHTMPKFTRVGCYMEFFGPQSVEGFHWKVHLFCLECYSEMILGDNTVLSGAAEHIPRTSSTAEP